VNALEEGTEPMLDFEKLSKVGQTGQAVIPVILANAETNEPLYVAYANEEALRETLRTRTAVLWSTSRNELWRKGASSGDVLDLVEVRVNCEQNALLYRVRPRSGVCHTRDSEGRTRDRCFYRRLTGSGEALEFV
jgi:phosphoribosyl-AMP cyclohydrolase